MEGPRQIVMLTALCSLAHTPSSAPFGLDAGSAGRFPSPGAWQSFFPSKLIRLTQRLVWAAKQALGKAALGALFA